MLTKKQLIDAARCHYTPKCHKECSFYYEIELADGDIMSDCSLKIAELAKTALAYRAMLERLEWSLKIHVVDIDLYFCPVCEKRKEAGHEPGCELAALLKESKVEKE